MIPKLIKYTGILAAVCYVLHDLLGNLFYPGYSFFTQAVSDLTALDSPSRWISQPLSMAYGVFSVLCVFMVCLYMRKKIIQSQYLGLWIFLLMNVISFLGYTFFPLSNGNSFQNTMHIVITVLVVLTSIASLLCIATGTFLRYGDKVLGIFAIVAFLFMLAGAILTNIAPPSVFGVVERFSTYSAVFYCMLIGIRCGKEG